MVNFYLYTVLWMAGCLFAGVPAFGGDPVASIASDPDHLFKIERSRDADVIYYEINLNHDGTLNSEDPFHVYWIKHTDDDRREPLTSIQRRLTYGIRYLERSPSRVVFQFRSTRERDFILQYNEAEHRHRAYIRSGENLMFFDKMYIHFGNDSFWNPQVDQVDLYLTDTRSGLHYVESFNP